MENPFGPSVLVKVRLLTGIPVGVIRDHRNPVLPDRLSMLTLVGAVMLKK